MMYAHAQYVRTRCAYPCLPNRLRTYQANVSSTRAYTMLLLWTEMLIVYVGTLYCAVTL